MKRPNILYIKKKRGNYLNCTQRHKDTKCFDDDYNDDYDILSPYSSMLLA